MDASAQASALTIRLVGASCPRSGSDRQSQALRYGQRLSRTRGSIAPAHTISVNVVAAKAEVDPKCHAAWSKRSLKQAKQRMYDLAHKVGITKNQLGVTWHGLRHQYAIDLLESMSGAVAPVRGGNFTMLDYKQLAAVRKKISLALGHSRTKITGAYYGSFTGLNNQHMRNLRDRGRC
jgi:integrase